MKLILQNSAACVRLGQIRIGQPRVPLPLFENDSKCETLLTRPFNCKSNSFSMKGFAHGLVLKQRQRATRKWPIVFIIADIFY